METFQLVLTDGPALRKCNFKTKESKGESESIECNYSFGISTEDENNLVSIKAGVTSDSENIPFSFDVETEIFFKIIDEAENLERDQKFEKEAIEQAWPYLFTFLKETVADLTRKAGLMPFNLPRVDLALQKVSE